MQILSHETWQLHQTIDLTMKQGFRQFYGQNKANFDILKQTFSKFGGNMLNNLQITDEIGRIQPKNASFRLID